MEGVSLSLIGYILGGVVGLLLGLTALISWIGRFIRETRQADKERRRKRITIVAAIVAFIGFSWIGNGLGKINDAPTALAISILSLGAILFAGGVTILFYMIVLQFRRKKNG